MLTAVLPACVQVYPYHMSDYVCRVQRITPFKYYNEVLFLTLKEEKSYDRIPNFTVRGWEAPGTVTAFASHRCTVTSSTVHTVKAL